MITQKAREKAVRKALREFKPYAGAVASIMRSVGWIGEPTEKGVLDTANSLLCELGVGGTTGASTWGIIASVADEDPDTDFLIYQVGVDLVALLRYGTKNLKDKKMALVELPKEF